MTSGKAFKEFVADYDGIICFGGEDWWYHNRGHNDIRFMQQFKKDVPVLFINSVGLRVPSLKQKSVFFGRITRKLKSIAKGLVKVEDNFWVLSPFFVPGKIGGAVSGSVLPLQIKNSARRMGIKKPLLWVVNLNAARYLDSLPYSKLIFQRSDRLETFPGGDEQLLNSYVDLLLRRADLTVYCNRGLMNDETSVANAPVFVDHGVDFERFSLAGQKDEVILPDVALIPHPRIGFVGGIEKHTFAPELFEEVVKNLPEFNFVMVGRNAMPPEWCVDYPNVHFLGMKELTEVADYMAACEVLIMPWNKTDWIKDCNPIKLKEYLAVGRPIVSTYFTELEHYDGYVRIANCSDSFAEEIKKAIEEGCDAQSFRERVRNETWVEKVKQLKEYLTHPPK